MLSCIKRRGASLFRDRFRNSELDAISRDPF